MLAYKGFDKDLKCDGFQYEVGETYETNEDIEVFGAGFYACKDPIDVMFYHTIGASRYCEVALIGGVEKEGDKVVTDKIKILRELEITEYLEICSKSAFDEDDANPVSDEDYANLASSEKFAIIMSRGYSAKIASSGAHANILSSGTYANIASSGDDVDLLSTGYYADILSIGNRAKLSSNGYRARLSSIGKNCIVSALGPGSVCKARKGSFIVLAEYGNSGSVDLKAAKIDGIKIKEDTFYKLENGEFVEAED